MNRIDLQQLAEARLREAEALLNAGEWSGAYYLAGYAVECGLKACIARQTMLEEFPDKVRVNDSHTHDFGKLLSVLKLVDERRDANEANPTLKMCWEVVGKWKETARYIQATESAARELVAAISDPTDGVLAWIKKYW